MMTEHDKGPVHLHPMPVDEVKAIAERILATLPSSEITVRDEVRLWIDDPTRHNGRRVERALRYAMEAPETELADAVAELVRR
jgi:hypothetical protein